MLLRILELDDNSAEHRFGVELVDQTGTRSYLVEQELPMPGNAVLEQLQCYFANSESADPDSSCVTRLLGYGQRLGDAIIGEDHELTGYRELIEDVGYEHLNVEIVGHSDGFAAVPWELLVLPDSKYVLSCVARRFVRMAAVSSKQMINYQLEPPSPTLSAIASSLEATEPLAASEEITTDPLRILYVIGDDSGTTQAVRTSADLLPADGAVELEIWSVAHHCWAELEARLLDQNRPVHVFHYVGCAEVGEEIQIKVCDQDVSQLISLTELSDCLQRANIYVLSLDVIMASSASVRVNRRMRRRWAEAASFAGIQNVLLLAHDTDRRSAARCFSEVYLRCGLGMTLSQAVTEARKSLQSEIQDQRLSTQAGELHLWPLLVHYSDCEITFLQKARAAVALQDSQLIRQINGKLFGFNNHYLLPRQRPVSDRNSLPVLQMLGVDQPGIVELTGSQGSGSQWVTHAVSWYLAYLGQIDMAFRFSREDAPFSRAIALQMIAPVLNMYDQAEDEVAAALHQQRCLFVFEPGSVLADEDEQQWLEELATNGHPVLVDRPGHPGLWFTRSVRVDMQIMSEREHHVLLAELLQVAEVDNKQLTSEWRGVLANTRGCPMLTEKLIPLVGIDNEACLELAETCIEHDDYQIDRYYELQWQRLSSADKLLLSQLAKHPGIYLEILVVGFGDGAFADELSAEYSMDEDSVQSLLENWRTIGLACRTEYGHILQEDECRFIRAQISLDDDSDTKALLFSRIICAGIAKVCRGALSQQDSLMMRHLLDNRRHWVQHFEKLWFAGCYFEFIAVLKAFDDLLASVNATTDSAAWLTDLLRRTTDVPLPEEEDRGFVLAWLIAAEKALQTVQGADEPFLDTCIARWQSWLLQQHSIGDQPAVYLQSAHLLVGRYAALQALNDCQRICSSVASTLIRHEVWQHALSWLQQLATYQLAGKELDAAFDTERQILEEIPYDGAPAGMREQAVLGVCAARVSRGIADQESLDMLEEGISNTALNDARCALQTEIHLLREEYLLALHGYCQLWSTYSVRGSEEQLDLIRPKFSDLVQHLGETVVLATIRDSIDSQHDVPYIEGTACAGSKE